MAVPTTIAQRALEFEPLFKKSLENVGPFKEAYMKRDDVVRITFLWELLGELQLTRCGFLVVSEYTDGYDDDGWPIHCVSCENGCECEDYQLNYLIMNYLADELIRIAHDGIEIGGVVYFMDTYNDLIYRFLRNQPVSCDDLKFISKKVHDQRRESTGIYAGFMFSHKDPRARFSGILRQPSRRVGDVQIPYPVDAGVVANLLKYFYVCESEIRCGKYSMKEIMEKNKKTKIHEKTYLDAAEEINHVYRMNPVKLPYRAKSFNSLGWMTNVETVDHIV